MQYLYGTNQGAVDWPLVCSAGASMWKWQGSPSSHCGIGIAEFGVTSSIVFDSEWKVSIFTHKGFTKSCVVLRRIPFVKTDRPEHFRRNGIISLLIKTLYEREHFSAKPLGKSLFHFQTDWSGYGPAGQFWQMESALSIRPFLGVRRRVILEGRRGERRAFLFYRSLPFLSFSSASSPPRNAWYSGYGFCVTKYRNKNSICCHSVLQ